LVAVLGFAQEGRATVTYLVKHGVLPVIFDEKPWEEWQADDQEYIKSLKLNFIFGPACLSELAGFDVAFRSPGIKAFHPSLVAWQKKGLSILSQTKWFFQHCPAKIIGVTGTKGKGTTSSLIFQMLDTQKDHKQLFLTGNIGETQPFEILDILTEKDWVVFELSSFQLQDLTVSPHIGVCLMTTSEHLDYHADLEEYLAAKEPISKFQNNNDFAIYNIDFLASRYIGSLGGGKKIEISTNNQVNHGCFVAGNRILSKGFTGANHFFNLDRIQLRGSHNLQNIAAAIAAALCAGAEPSSIQKIIEEFKGLNHRLELVGQKNGVIFYNDSFSTTPETAIAAIEAFHEPKILILGGAIKGSDFSELAKAIVRKEDIKAIVLIGQEAENIQLAISAAGEFSGALLKGAKNMKEIIEQAVSLSAPGDVVVLSPACASFDMFKNYKDRGEKFKSEVMKLGLR